MALCAHTGWERAGKPWLSGRRLRPASSRSLLVMGLVLITSGLAGCGSTGAANTPSNNQQPTGDLSAPPTLGFGNVAVGSSSNQTITLNNSGSAAVNVTQATFSNSSFSAPGLTLPMSVAAGQSATMQIQFAPKSAGAVSGSLSVTSDASNSPVSVSLTGAGTQGQLAASPGTIAFGNVAVNGSTSQTVTLSNAGSASVIISQATASGAGFSLSGLNVPATVNAGGNISFTVVFAPTIAGSASGSVQITSNASNPSLMISLGGFGTSSTPMLSSNPTSVTFGDVAAGQSTSSNVSVTNTGSSTVTITQVTGPGAPYTVSGITANQTIGAEQSATLNVNFAPTTTGSFTGNVTITSTATNSPMAIAIAGGSHSVSLSWTASTSTVVGYNVYRGTVSGGPYTLVNSSLVAGTTYTDLGIASGQTYYYVVTAVNSSGAESVYSNQASAAVPTP
jgi:hypothetical protein